jgi:hypothetical protein
MALSKQWKIAGASAAATAFSAGGFIALAGADSID